MEQIIVAYINTSPLNKLLFFITLIGITGFVFWCVSRIIKTFKKFKFGNMEINNTDSEGRVIDFPRGHLHCPNVASLLLLEELRDRYHEDKMEISDRYSINLEQMITARTTIDSVLLDWEGEIKEDDIPYKRLILENIRNMVLNKVAEVLQENHLAEMTAEDFLIRMKQRSEAIASLIFTNSLNNKIEDDMKAMLKYCIIDIIKKAREIQIERNNKVERLKAQYKEKREKILKGELVEVCA